MTTVESILCCPKCKHAPAEPGGCPRCAFVLQRSESGVAYDYLALLRKAFPARYPLYKALCNNGYVSYHELASSSLSLPERKDVAEFAAFLARQVKADDFVIDIGCGPLPVPGYLAPLHAAGARLLGLDVYPTEFQGFRITGCAEFLPLTDGSLDVVIFATSLDHVCDLAATLREVRRVLRRGGHCCIWMSDRQPYWKQFFFRQRTLVAVARRLFLGLPKQVALNVRNGRRLLYGVTHYFTRGRYWIYESGSAFYCPPGAVDPFHSFFESPAEIAKLAASHGLIATAEERASNGVFLALTCRG